MRREGEDELKAIKEEKFKMQEEELFKDKEVKRGKKGTIKIDRNVRRNGRKRG